MKKALIALAVVGAYANAVQAQSSVEVYGSVDAGVRYQTNVNAAGDSVWTMGTGNYYSNRLGFRGREDLGGGLSALFQLESGYSVKTGAQDAAGVMFNRTAAVGVSGPWGTLTMGRQYTVAFRTVSLYDPFSYKYTGLIPLSSGAGSTLPSAATTAGLGASATSGTRFNNNVQYSGVFGPVTARAEYAFGEVAGDASRSAAKAVGASYADGNAVFGAVYTTKETAAGDDNTSYSLGGAYKFGDARVTAGYSDEKQEITGRDLKNKLAWGGVSYKFTPVFEVTGAYYQSKASVATGDGKRELFIVGATYMLSKRTNLYAEVDRNKYSGVMIPSTRQSGQTGVSAGVNHLF
jgi:predicted porin